MQNTPKEYADWRNYGRVVDSSFQNMTYMKISFQEVAEMLAELTIQFTPSGSGLSWTY
jgi:hypothetical protein